MINDIVPANISFVSGRTGPTVGWICIYLFIHFFKTESTLHQLCNWAKIYSLLLHANVKHIWALAWNGWPNSLLTNFYSGRTILENNQFLFFFISRYHKYFNLSKKVNFEWWMSSLYWTDLVLFPNPTVKLKNYPLKIFPRANLIYSPNPLK